MGIKITVDGGDVTVDDPSVSLLDVLRHQVGARSVKDGCSPQGQCGCCTVLVDGQPRVACVTPVRRIAGRAVTTLDGLDPDIRDRWLKVFTACGASQCGFCTPGIIVRLAGTAQRADTGEPLDNADIEQALAAHLCRCTGWSPIVKAATMATTDGFTLCSPHSNPLAGRDINAAGQRAALEGGWPQQVGVNVAAGEAGFAADTVPPGALVALPDDRGGWVVADSVTQARRLRSKVQGRRTTRAAGPPLELPPGDWDLTLRTSWVEPAYLETDASWCEPGGEPTSPLANGGAFGGKADSVVPDAARQLADVHQRPVLALLDREDTVRIGPKRPPVAIGIRSDGTGIMRVVDTPGIAAAVAAVAPGVTIESVTAAGPPTSPAVRGAGWMEALVAVAAAQGNDTCTSPSGATAKATIGDDGAVHVAVACGDPLDETVLRSYCTGAAHMAIGWVTSEALAVDADGTIGDLTIRSFGVLKASETPAITVTIDPSLGDTTGPPRNASDAVMAAVTLAVWGHQGWCGTWPSGKPLRSG